jgi:nucleotide-binding universal stress UspA family protein
MNIASVTEAPPLHPAHRIVVGVDGSKGSVDALEWAAREAEQTGAVLDLHTAYEPGYVFVTRDEVKGEMVRVLDNAAERVAALAPQVTTMSEIHEDSPDSVLIAASEGADLLVVGSRGLGGFEGLLLGSVSQKCCQHAHCPTVIVRR